MSLLTVAENQAVAPMPDDNYLAELSSGGNLPHGKSDPIGEQMRTKGSWIKVRTAHTDSGEYSRTEPSGIDLQDIDRVLQKVRAEAEEERRLDSELDAIQETAYKDVDRFLRTVYASDYGTIGRLVSLADIMPLDNGEIGLEWREEQKIFTLSFGGDGHIVFAGVFSSEHHARGILSFSDPHFITIIGMITCLYT